MCQVYNQDTALKPIIKWPGGKEKELEFIFPNAPTKINNYYEPFVGGGSVFMAFNANKFFINGLMELKQLGEILTITQVL